MKHEEWLSSSAYRDLRPVAKCLLEEFQRIYLPGRNGFLVLPVKKAAQLLNINKDTASKAFHELSEHGFIALTKGSLWQDKLAREWRITFEPYMGREPTDDWRKWQPDKTVNHRVKKLRSENLGLVSPKKMDKPSQKFGQEFQNLRAIEI